MRHRPDCQFRCGNHEPFLTVPRNQGERTTTLVQCRDCGVVYEDPRPPKEEIDAFYRSADLWTRSTDAEGNARSYVREIEAKKPLFEDLIRRMERFKAGGSLLDVGCGAGLLQACLDPARWNVTGVESSTYIAEFGRRELGAAILPLAFEDADLPARHYDAVVMKYVLDHMEEPCGALEKARRLIKPDGLLVIADLINIDSFCARFFREGHRLIHPMHFTYFSPGTISDHLDRIGFRVVHIDFPYWKTPYCTRQNNWNLVKRIGQRLWNRYVLRNNHVVYSTAFYGNMMDVFAVPK